MSAYILVAVKRNVLSPGSFNGMPIVTPEIVGQAGTLFKLNVAIVAPPTSSSLHVSTKHSSLK